MSKSKHTQAILEIIKAQDNLQTGDIAEALDLSVSRTRELLAAEIKAGNISRDHAEVDGCKVLVYSVGGKAQGPAEAATEKAEDLKAPKAKKEKVAKTKTPKIAKEKKPRKKASGAGKPNAKKVVNPQQTLDLKKAMVERAGGKMVWANRIWTITIKGDSTSFKSRELAGFTLEALAAELGI